jgi:hypothetical protein
VRIEAGRSRAPDDVVGVAPPEQRLRAASAMEVSRSGLQAFTRASALRLTEAPRAIHA